jgi:hypothetical protein
VAAAVACPRRCLLPLIRVCSCASGATGNPSSLYYGSPRLSFDPIPGGGALLRCGRAHQLQQRRLPGCCSSAGYVAGEVASHLLPLSRPFLLDVLVAGAPNYWSSYHILVRSFLYSWYR